MELATIFTAAGIGAAAGYRATIPALALGALHHLGWTTLGPDWVWIAATPTMVVLGVLAVCEFVADRSSDFGELSDMALRVPRLLVGVFAAAAATGTLDPSLSSLVSSGVIGAGAAIAADRARAKVREATRDAAQAGISTPDRLASSAEDVGVLAAVVAALTAPWTVLVVGVASLVVGGVLLFLARRLHKTAARVSGLEGVAP